MSDYQYQQGAWSLDALYKGFDDPELEASYQNLAAAIEGFEALRPELQPSLDSARFNEILKQHEGITRGIYTLYGHASLAFAANYNTVSPTL